ncbi:MAG: hypothetical protein R3B38_01735 [Patescibacteria group bacterium]
MTWVKQSPYLVLAPGQTTKPLGRCNCKSNVAWDIIGKPNNR